MKKIFILFLIFFASKTFSFSDINYTVPCKEFNKTNYKLILLEKEANLFINPFSKKCFLLSFKKNDPLKKINFIKTNNEDILFEYFNFKSKSGLEVIHVKLESNKKYTYDFLKYDTNGNKFKILNFAKKMKLSFSEDIEELFFLHETFHLTPFDFDENNLDYFKNEVFADIGAILILASNNNYSIEKTIQYIDDLKYFRINILDLNKNKNTKNLYFYEKAKELLKSKEIDINSINSFLDVFNKINIIKDK